MVEHFPKRKPLLPIIHNPKALKLADREEKAAAQVRCFYALAHRGANPLESDFHMQARLGFRRRNNNNVRLLPIELLPPHPEKILPKPTVGIGSRKPLQGRQRSKEDLPRMPQGSKQHHSQPSRNSNSPVGVAASRRSSNSPVGVEGRWSPVSVVDMDMAGVTWTTFAKVTDETVGTVVSGALGDMMDEHSTSETLFERLDKSMEEKPDEAKTPSTKKPLEQEETQDKAKTPSGKKPFEQEALPVKAKIPLGKKPERSQDEIIEFSVAPPQVKQDEPEDAADLAWKKHAKEKAALVIQSQRRGNTCRKSLKEHRNEKEQAAVRLQKLQRGRMARKSVHARKTLPQELQAEVLPKREAGNGEEVSTTLVETSARAKSFLRSKSHRRSLEDVEFSEESPRELGASASKCVDCNTTVGAQVSTSAHFAQKPSIGSWLTVRYT